MLCFLCLQKQTNAIKLFDTVEGFNVAFIISKHFWLKPQEKYLESNYNVCQSCWYVIKCFHIFHTKVEEAHQNLNNLASGLGTEDPLTEILKTEIEDFEKNIDWIGDQDDDDLQDKFISKTPELRRSGRRTFKRTRTTKELKIRTSQSKKPQNETLGKETKSETMNIQDNENGSNLIEDNIEQLDEIKKSVQIPKEKRRRNVLRTADEVDEKITKFMQLTCNICECVCPTLAALKAHFRTTHEKKGYAMCCNKKFFKRYLLIDHIDTHLNPEHFKCKECDKIFTVADCLKRHVQELHNTEKCFYFCDKCPKKFIRQKLLERHKVFHNPIEQWTFVCDDCGKVFPSKFYLKSHTTFSHNKLPTKICHICGKAVHSNRYKKHLLEHDGITEPKIQCEICGAWLQKKYMGTHKINHREAEIIHSCTICGKISPNRRALYIHMRYTHAEQRNHECKVCSKTFKRRLALKQHMAIHTGDNLYKCTYCPKTFTYDSNFHNHKKKEHPKEHEEEKKRVHRTDFVKCSTQEKQQNTNSDRNEQFV